MLLSLCTERGFRNGRGRRWGRLGEVVTGGGHAGEAHRDFGCESHLSLDVTPVGADADGLIARAELVEVDITVCCDFESSIFGIHQLKELLIQSVPVYW